LPKEGFKAITVSEDLWEELNQKAKHEGLSLAQLIETYMAKPHSVNDLLWLNLPSEIERRKQEMANVLYTPYITNFHRQRAKKLKLEGEDPNAHSLSYEENQELEKTARAFCQELAGVIVEKDKETFEEWKKLDEERRLKTWLSALSDQVKTVRKDSKGILEGVTYKSNAEAITEKLTEIHEGLEAIDRSIEAEKDNVILVSKLVVEWDKLRKYVPYLSDEAKELDRSIAEILGVE